MSVELFKEESGFVNILELESVQFHMNTLQAITSHSSESSKTCRTYRI